MITDYMCRGLLNRAFATTPESARLVPLAIPSPTQLPAGSTERLDFLGNVSPVREWIGPRQGGTIGEYYYTLKNRKWTNVLDLKMEWLRGDKTNNVANAIAMFGVRMWQWRERMIADLINNGTAGGTYIGFDGLSYFNANHVWGTVTQSNIVTYATSAGPALMTPYEAAKNMAKAYQQLISMLDDKGEPVNEDVSEVTIAVPVVQTSQMAMSFIEAMDFDKLDTGSGSVDNPVKGFKSRVKTRLVVSPRLTGTSAVMFNSSPMSVPFVFQENVGERILATKGAGSDFEFDQDKWSYGVRLVGNTGYGRFTDAVQMQFT